MEPKQYYRKVIYCSVCLFPGLCRCLFSFPSDGGWDLRSPCRQANRGRENRLNGFSLKSSLRNNSQFCSSASSVFPCLTGDMSLILDISYGLATLRGSIAMLYKCKVSWLHTLLKRKWRWGLPILIPSIPIFTCWNKYSFSLLFRQVVAWVACYSMYQETV